MKGIKFDVAEYAPRLLFTVDSGKITPSPKEIDWEQMSQSDAVGTDVIIDTSGEKPFGLGWIKFPPFGEVKLHIHDGSHILICFAGAGDVKIELKRKDGLLHTQSNPISIGECYNIESLVPHSVHARAEGLTLLVIGNEYRPAVSSQRLQMISGE